MSIKNQQTRRRRPSVDPRTIKKHSQVMQRKANNIVVVGKKEKTETGYKISGYAGKGVETFFETLLPGTASAVVKHPKKDRVLTILSGGGFVVLKESEQDAIDKRIHPGDEIVIKAGTSYRLATTSEQPLEVHVAQDSKYEAHMQVLEEPAATAKVTPELLTPAERGVYITPGEQIRKGSKARQQQAKKQSKRVPTSQVIAPGGVLSAPDGAAKEAAVMNARPSMGRFDEAGAG